MSEERQNAYKDYLVRATGYLSADNTVKTIRGGKADDRRLSIRALNARNAGASEEEVQEIIRVWRKKAIGDEFPDG